MSKEKQIEEMAEVIDEVGEYIILGITDCVIKTKLANNSVAKSLYNAGYRKQSEGRWEKRVFIIFDSEKVGFRCSECNTTWDTETHYCPNCGAKMKGGAE